MEEDFDAIFVLIKDSISEESEIIDSDFDHSDLSDRLYELIEKENSLIEHTNNRPLSLMESKHSDYRVIYPKFLPVDLVKDKELLRFSDGRRSYRIEEVR